MTKKELMEMQNLRQRVVAQREEINRLQEENKRLKEKQAINRAMEENADETSG